MGEGARPESDEEVPKGSQEWEQGGLLAAPRAGATCKALEAICGF